MFEILSLSLSILAGSVAQGQTPPPCHWLTVDLGQLHDLSPKTRKRACRWEPTLQTAAKTHDLDPDLLGGLIVTESAWKPWVVSHANACGLTQVIPKWTGGSATGRRKWTCAQLKQPAISIPVGARILRWWIDYHAEKQRARGVDTTNAVAQAEIVRQALCGYNAGFRGCKRAGARYARKVLKLRGKLKVGRAAIRPPKSAPKESENSIQVDN